MTMYEIEAAVDQYAAELETYILQFGLPEEWFGEPDHVAIKCSDRADFEAQVEQLRPHAEEIRAIDMDGRTLATARLASSLAVGSFGEVQLIEIMEPRPEKVGKGLVGFEHMEFTYPDLGLVMSYLEQHRASYEYEENPGHRWVNMVINSHGQELKINDRSLTDVLALEAEAGKGYVL